MNTPGTAVVTGASRGLGPALARGLGAAGWNVVIDARSAADLLVNNAGVLGPSPLPALVDLRTDALRDLLDASVVAPLASPPCSCPTCARAAAPF